LSDQEALYAIFRSGMSTSDSVNDVSGRGVGLDVVRAQLERMRGRVQVSTEPGAGTKFRITVPVSLAFAPCLIVGTGGERYAIPKAAVETIMSGGATDVHTVEGRQVITHDGQSVALTHLCDVLGVEAQSEGAATLVLRGLTRNHALVVDELGGQRDLVVKTLGGNVPPLPLMAGVSVEPDGAILPVLDPGGVVDAARMSAAPRPGRHAEVKSVIDARPSSYILVVDDMVIIRELQKSILTRAGYHVLTAADGRAALETLASERVSVVLTDVEMPGMSGFELVESIRSTPGIANVGIVMLTSLATEEDRLRGLEAGADRYIVKGEFNETALLDIVAEMVGPA
jgi:two-component system chemotaxis sensor kinase CheA